MDLSCSITYEKKVDYCSYQRLTTIDCQHSGNIRSIPNKIGTAEYIDLNINDFRKEKAKYVTFTCNAYSEGNITPNLVVGWMNSKFSMKISERTGVAYDPSCVQHQVRITQNAAKGLVFGLLEISTSEIIWLEMTFSGQVVQGLDTRNVEALLSKINAKLSIGNLLKIKAEDQGLTIIDTNDADEIYDVNWASNTVAVTSLLVD